MMSDLIAEKIDTLREKINYHNQKYYVLAEPEISDYEFDNVNIGSVNNEYKYM